MRSADERSEPLACTRCGVALEICAFCEREDCTGDVICYRCLRNDLLQSLTPSVHRR
jgi:hypothetical protein